MDWQAQSATSWVQLPLNRANLWLTIFTAGSYTVIVSTFEAQKHLGPFSLRVESSRRVSLEGIPQEGAGMYSKVVKGSWFVAIP